VIFMRAPPSRLHLNSTPTLSPTVSPWLGHMLRTSRTSPFGLGGSAACSSFTADVAASEALGPAACFQVSGRRLCTGMSASLVPLRQISALLRPPTSQPSNSLLG